MFISFVLSRKKKRIILLVAAALILLFLVKLYWVNRISAAVGQKQRLVPIYYVDTTEPKIAISFDASWGAEFTPKILEILRENKLKTTFFLTGLWIDKYPELVKQIAAEGHELGNHTATHPHLNSLDKEAIIKELTSVHNSLKELSGQEITLFRPPFGEYSNKVIETCSEFGYQTIQWSVDSLDWKEISKDEIVKRVTSQLHPGAIVLFHNNGRYTADALPEIISFATENGYKIVPISQLLYKDDYYIDPNDGAQRKNNPAANNSPPQ
ncbi:MAG TPA: deacetylase [Firmicutes bacterium]|jgi:polysaccharide deacetylase family sporulation protein PdaB|nr:polysaccharide deacetylase family protein [Bacillota bacterium]HAA38392.1 deacetylase [Bacillota bacterium]